MTKGLISPSTFFRLDALTETMVFPLNVGLNFPLSTVPNLTSNTGGEVQPTRTRRDTRKINKVIVFILK
jgi:hypothetical protein